MGDEFVATMDLSSSRRTAAILAAAVLGLVTSAAMTGSLGMPAPGAWEAMGDQAVEDEPSFSHHPPIVIRGDEGAIGLILGHDPLTGDPIHRPGSGVMDGTGTQDRADTRFWATRSAGTPKPGPT